MKKAFIINENDDWIAPLRVARERLKDLEAQD